MAGMSARSKRPVLVMLGVIAALLALDAALLLSARQLEARFRHTLARVFRTPVEVGHVSLSLLSGLRVHGLVVYGPSGERAIAVDEAAIGVDWRRLEPGEVRIEWPSLDVRVDAAGRVNLLEALDPSLLEGRGDGGAPELPRLIVRVSHASLRLRHAEVLAPDQVVGLDDLSVDVRTGKDGLEAAGTLVDPLAKEVLFTAGLDARSGALRVDAEIRKVHVENRSETKMRIPPMFWAAWDLLRMHGTGDIAIKARKERDRPPSVRVEIDVHEGGVNVTKFPYPSKDVRGKVVIEKDGVPVHVQLIGLHGAREGGTFGCDGDLLIMPKGVDDHLDLRIWGKNMPVDATLVDALPPPVDEIVRRFEPTGRGDARVRIHGRLKAPGEKDEVHIEVDATTRDVRARFRDFPVPVELGGTIALRDFKFSFEDFGGAAAGGKVRLRGSASPEEVDVRVEVTGARADESLEAALLPKHREIVQMIQPRGKVNARIDIVGEPDPKDDGMRPTFRAKITAERGLTAKFADFPYPLVWQEGVVKISPDGARIEGVRAGGGPPRSPLAVTVNGVIRADDVDGGGLELFIDATHLPIDGALALAAEPAAAKVVKVLGPEAGEIAELVVDAVVPRAGAKLQLDVDALVKGGVIVPDALGVPVYDIDGHVRLRPDRVEIGGITARVVDAKVRGSGFVGIVEGVTGTAVVDLDGLQLDGPVEYELPDKLRKVYEMVRPAGVLSARFTLTGSGGDLEPRLAASLANGGFMLSFFPLAATGIEARLDYAKDVVRIEGLRGRFGEGTIEGRGALEMRPEGPPAASFAARLRALPLDRRLVDVLPESSRQAFADLAWKGRADLDMRLSYEPGAAPGGLLSYVVEGDLVGSSLDVGVALDELDGTIRAHGSWPLDRIAFPELEGGLFLRRATWKGQELSQLRGRFAISDRMIEVKDLRGELLGGIAWGKAYLYTEAPKLWGADFHLAGGRIERWVEKKYSGEKKASGRLDVDATLVGVNGGATPVMSGEGLLEVKDGRLFELPTFAGILSALSLELPGKPVFDVARVEMRFEPKRIRLPRIEFSSSAISFMGGGVYQDGKMRLRLTHELGRAIFSPVPGFGDFWNWLKGNILELEVVGSPDDPKVRVIPLKMFTDSARWLIEQGREVFDPDRPSEEGD